MRNYKVLHVAILVMDVLAFIAVAMGIRAFTEEITKAAVYIVVIGSSWALLSLFIMHPWESLLEDVREIRESLTKDKTE